MSHITTIDIEIKDLDALDAACKRCGLELHRGKESFKWWGHRDKRCSHAIGVPGNAEAYEIGVVKREQGGFGLELDQDAGDVELVELCGRDCQALKQAYAVEVAMAEAQRQGMTVQEEQLQDGTVRLHCTSF